MFEQLQKKSLNNCKKMFGQWQKKFEQLQKIEQLQKCLNNCKKLNSCKNVFQNLKKRKCSKSFPPLINAQRSNARVILQVNQFAHSSSSNASFK
jgi:hypothetical protein